MPADIRLNKQMKTYNELVKLLGSTTFAAKMQQDTGKI